MIKNSLKYPLFGLIFIFSLVAFLPKENIYFYYLEKLQEKKISIQNEERSSSPFHFLIVNGDIFYKEINAFKIESIDISYLLVYGKIAISNVLFDGLTIEQIDFKWNLLSPFVFDIVIISNEINGYGKYDILDKGFELYLKPSSEVVKKYEIFWNFGELTPNGEYKIEYNL
jgi:hypothetical protein